MMVNMSGVVLHLVQQVIVSLGQNVCALIAVEISWWGLLIIQFTITAVLAQVLTYKTLAISQWLEMAMTVWF